MSLRVSRGDWKADLVKTMRGLMLERKEKLNLTTPKPQIVVLRVLARFVFVVSCVRQQ